MRHPKGSGGASGSARFALGAGRAGCAGTGAVEPGKRPAHSAGQAGGSLSAWPGAPADSPLAAGLGTRGLRLDGREGGSERHGGACAGASCFFGRAAGGSAVFHWSGQGGGSASERAPSPRCSAAQGFVTGSRSPASRRFGGCLRGVCGLMTPQCSGHGGGSSLAGSAAFGCWGGVSFRGALGAFHCAGHCGGAGSPAGFSGSSGSSTARWARSSGLNPPVTSSCSSLPSAAGGMAASKKPRTRAQMPAREAGGSSADWLSLVPGS